VVRSKLVNNRIINYSLVFAKKKGEIMQELPKELANDPIYNTMSSQSVILPDYENPAISRKFAPENNPVKTFNVYYSRDQYVEVDSDKVSQNKELFAQLVDKLDDQLSQEDMMKIIKTIRERFGVDISTASKRNKENTRNGKAHKENKTPFDEELEQLLESYSEKKHTPKKKLNLQKNKAFSNKTSIIKKRKSIKAIFHLEDFDITTKYEKIRIGDFVLSNKKRKFLAVIERKNKSTGIRIKPSVINKLIALELPRINICVKLEPIVFEFDISKKYKCIIFIISEIIKNNKNRIKDSLQQEEPPPIDLRQD
jgi:hypothetical protein